MQPPHLAHTMVPISNQAFGDAVPEAGSCAVRRPAIILALCLAGCAHAQASSDPSITSTVVEATAVPHGSPPRPEGAVNPIDVVWVADVTAVEEATASPGIDPLCGDAATDPPHVCPGTTPAPSSPPESGSPPPPPD